MILIIIIIGFLFGFIGSIPLAGPVAVFILSNCLNQYFYRAKAIALGASFAESIYAFAAFMGMTLLISQYPQVTIYARYLSIAILIILGFIFYQMKHNKQELPDDQPLKIKRSFVKGAVLIFLNPTIIISWSTIILSLKSYVDFHMTTINGLWFSLGIFTGVTSWFLIMIKFIKKHHHRLDAQFVEKIYKIIALVLIILALKLMWLIYTN